jgi:hypothetical protein
VVVQVTQLEKMKTKLGMSLTDVSKDDLLNLYLEDAEKDILELSHLPEVSDALLSTQVDLAILYYNKQGIEGQTAHSEGGISRTFEGVPDNILRKIRSRRRLPR